MPSPQWSPAEVLDLDPNCSDFRCVGYAPSKGQQCQNPIACANRQESAKMLLEMSRLDPCSQRLDDKLEELAFRLLCKRNHQNQAADMTRKWRHNIAVYQAADIARQWRHNITVYQAAQTARQRQRSTTVRTRPAPAQPPVAHTPAISPGRGRTASVVTLQPTHVSRLSITISIAITEDPAVRENNEPNEDQHEEISITEEPRERDNSESSESSPEEHGTEAPVQGQAPEESPDDHGRRAIEGDCSICCDDLHSSGDTVWCRAQCRQNFHAECVNSWHASQEADDRRKTCPYCRTAWAA